MPGIEIWAGMVCAKHNRETDLFSKVIDLGDQRALLNVHVSLMLLEITDQASIHLSLHSTDD